MSDLESNQKDAVIKRSPQRRRDLNRLPTTQIPSRLRYGDDVDDDVTAPSRAGPAAAQYMNQSIFSMIAVAGSKTDYNARFDESSESEGDAVISEEPEHGSESRTNATMQAREGTIFKKGSVIAASAGTTRNMPTSGQGRPQSAPKLALRTTKMKESLHTPTLEQSRSDTSQEVNKSHPQNVPVMSRILTAEAEPETQGAVKSQHSQQHDPSTMTKTKAATDPSSSEALAAKIKDIFYLESPEQIVAEYQCWLLQSALLQGYIYITDRHICFYAFLHNKSHVVTKSGYLSKRGRTTSTYRRSWFTLKGDVLTYFSSSTDLYYPQGHIDLRYGISASLVADKTSPKDSCDFLIQTDKKTYYFRADSAASAKEWIKTIQRTIFRTHNEGDSVKIVLPIENIIDVELSPVVDFAETLKIRIIETGDSYAIDEYFFTFFTHGEDVLGVFGSLIGKAAAGERHEIPHSPGSDQATVSSPHNKFPGDELRSNTRSDRALADLSDRQRTTQQQAGTAASLQQRTAELYVQSSADDRTDSSVAPVSPDANMSASQILVRSDVFRPPPPKKLSTLASLSDHELDNHSVERPNAPISSNDRGENRDIEEPAPRTAGRSHKESQDGAAESDLSEQRPPRTTGSPALQEIVKVGAYPLNKAGALAGYIKSRSTKMSKALATESMSYLEKVTGMWQGGHKHYGRNEGVVPGDGDVDPEDEEANVGHGDRFRAHFGLPETEKLHATYFGYLTRVLPLYGKIYVSNRKFCFRSLLPGTRTKLVLPLKDIENVDKEKGFRFGYAGLVLVIRGHEEIFFEFRSTDTRDDCTVTLLQSLESVRFMAESGLLAQEDEVNAAAAVAEHQTLRDARKGLAEATSLDTDQTIYNDAEVASVLFDDTKASVVDFKPPASLRITCLTIGSRGDVQPYIALCKGLLADGHRPLIATHAEFGPWIMSHGIDFEAVGGDPAELMRICVEHGMFTYSFLREATVHFRTWLDELLSSSWKACQGSDVLIESPSAMAGIHIAEALGIPYFRAFTMPWTRTRAYPHAFAVPEQKVGGAYNYFSYVMFENVFWKGIAGQVNRWRKRELGLRATNLDKMLPNKVPFLYNFSPQVVPPPLDYSDWVRVTGYWFLDEGTTDWTPPKDLFNFIAKARRDGKKLVYIGFGSIVVSDPTALTRTVVDSVLKADVRCILSKGWSDRLGDPSSTKAEVPLPPEILQIKSAPHDWLFFQVDAAVHHGGAGTTGASLRAGIPTVIKPFFGDQFFFGGRVGDLGVGILLRKVNVSVFARALWEACNNERLKVKAKALGEAIRNENGVQTAIDAIYRDLEYASTLTQARRATSKPTAQGQGTPMGDATNATSDYETEADVEGVESWTFVNDGHSADSEARSVPNKTTV